MSPALVGHWPFAVRAALAVNCAGAGVPTKHLAENIRAVQMDVTATNAKADAERRPIRDIVHSPKVRGQRHRHANGFVK
jgi:hypothetical protein